MLKVLLKAVTGKWTIKNIDLFVDNIYCLIVYRNYIDVIDLTEDEPAEEPYDSDLDEFPVVPISMTPKFIDK